MIITAPEPVSLDLYPHSQYTWLFPAGGITKAELWQPRFCTTLDQRFANLLITNPRREVYEHTDEAAEFQISWEHYNLINANIRSFYFAPEQLQPITLFEYGVYLSDDSVPLVVAAHPDYPRRLDVLVQTRLYRPDIVVLDSLEDLIEATADQLTRMGQPTKQ